MTELPDGLPTGEAVATDPHRLPARWVIHTVGPNRHAGQSDPALLAACFRNSLTLASSLGARSIALPAVSAGIYGWDADEVAQVAVDAVRSTDAPGVELVRFVLFSARLLDAFETALSASTV